MEVYEGIEYSKGEDCSTSDLTDIENDGEEVECGGTESSSTASVGDGERRGVKRGYCMRVDSGAVDAAVVQPERRLRSRLHEQFALLRAAVPNLRTDERASILTGAYEYIERLKRQEEELLCELGVESSCDEEDLSCCEDEVEVVRTEAGFRIHIECGMRPGLLLAIMELLESSGLSVEEATVECEERLVFNGIGLEDDEGISEAGEASNLTRVSSEFLGASLRSLVSDQRQGSTV
ncbi:hypothetical protein KC19_11G072200 [Ceratodon purpureus]|uniref:BHLH domain-containing protein n=1 Tax=Ceratodon purpureus TaxID=3225 RepID=A0A8T0GHR2_CERPU|nr:hypothetical protein KC19_11G072200 [Ceratodon purpureus]